MTTIERSIEVELPVETVYNQWTQFEEFPRFMEGVEAVQQFDDTRLHWVANIAGQRREWDAEITEQVPDQRIAWRSTGGTSNGGVVTFHRLTNDRTKVMLQLEHDPEGAVEQIGEALGIVERRAAGDLKRFRDYVEERGQASGAWRGEVQRPGSN